MAGRVAASGHVVSVLDVSEGRAKLAVANGLRGAKDIAAASAADVVVSSLPNDIAAIEALAGADGVLRHLRPASLLIDTSTISLAASDAISRAAELANVAYVCAPVSGSTGAAASGALTSFVSGAPEAVAKAEAVLSTYSSRIVPVGLEGQARIMKLAVNLMVTTLVVSLAEANAMCRKAGIESKVALDAICSSAVSSPHLRFKADYLARDDFTPTFTVSQIRKDTKLIVDSARELGVPLLLGGVVDQVMTAAESVGFADDDYLSCSKIVAQLSGI